MSKASATRRAQAAGEDTSLRNEGDLKPRDGERAEDSAAQQPVPDWLQVAVDAAADRKAEKVRLLDLRGKCDYADFFLICTGRSDRQVLAIAESIDAKLRAAGQRPLHSEGEREARWILIDYADLVVHVFDPPTRDFYRLERLWSDAPVIADLDVGGAGETASPGLG